MNYTNTVMVLKAMADETRLKIIEMLCSGELCACKILENFNITQPTLSYHMKILCDSGIVEGRRDGAWMRYTINKEKFEEMQGILNSLIVRENASLDATCCKR